jgi:hypothetical protein
MKRSVNVDVELEAGTYLVLMKILAKRWTGRPTVEEVIRDNCRDKQDKLIQIGLAYDLAHAKGQIKESEAEKKEREAREERKRVAEKKKLRANLREQKFKHWQLDMKQRAREKRQSKRKEDRRRKKAEAAASHGGAGPDMVPAAKDTSEADPPGAPSETDPPGVHVEADPSGATPNGVAAADGVSEPVDTKKGETAKLDQDAATLPSPAADLPTPADPSPPADVQTSAQDTAPIEPAEPAASVESHARNETPAPNAASEEQSKNFESALQTVPSVLVNGSSPDTDPAPPSTASGPPPDDLDYESDASFHSSVDSDLDFFVGQEVDVPDVVVADTDDEDAEFADDPWNAVCVVGLRVYSKDKDSVVQVVRPTEDDENDEPPLDIDDVSKGASGEQVGEPVDTKTGRGE